MSVSQVLVPLAVSFLATLAWTGVSGSWTARSVGSMFVYGFLLLWLVSVIHA